MHVGVSGMTVLIYLGIATIRDGRYIDRINEVRFQAPDVIQSREKWIPFPDMGGAPGGKTDSGGQR